MQNAFILTFFKGKSLKHSKNSNVTTAKAYCMRYWVFHWKRFTHYVLLFFYALLACDRPAQPDQLKEALRAAGTNRAELEKVLQHYQNQGDSLKLKAAVYLITRLPYSHSYWDENIEKYDPIFAELNGMDVGRAVEMVFDRYEEKHGSLELRKMDRVMDARTATADFLIENIDLAFEAWRNNPWSKDIDFELFCQAILPHRASNELLESWRPLFIERYNWLKDSLKNIEDKQEILGWINRDLGEGFKITLRWRYPFMPKYSQMLHCSVGTCDVLSSMQVSALRALGIPAYKDFVMRFGNKEYGHAWAVMLDEKGNPYWCFDEHDAYARNDIPIASSYIPSDSIGTRYLPTGVVVDSLKTIPKIYRITIFENPEQMALLNAPHANEIIKGFDNPCLHDVTRLYMKDCQNITLQFAHVPRGVHFAYLGVFAKQKWEPVAIAKIANNKAVFKDVGQNVVFVPIGIKKGRQIPLGPAFYLKNGKKIELIPDTAERQRARIERKTNFFANTLEKANLMIRGSFEGANNPDFSDAVTLHTIRQTPLYMQNIALDPPQVFRYMRYKAPTDRPNHGDIAELEFYTGSGAQQQKLSGSIIGTADVPGVTRDKAFDGDWDSYFRGEAEEGNWIGMDLGTPKSITKIRFCPRNDTNIVLKNNLYFLYYWDGEWKSLGAQRATDHYLIYDNIPKNALLWLRNATGGKEENVFILKNERQVFF